MDIMIFPGKLHGQVAAIPSKSQAHRALICAAFADAPTILLCPDTNRDIEATADCLNALGANILRTASGYRVEPVTKLPRAAVLPCSESGSTLRFLLPIVGALGVDGTFLMEGRLPQRPLSPLWEEMERMGCSLSRPTENTLLCQGKLQGGAYSMDGGISSQFITGLMFALALMDAPASLKVTGKVESKPYIRMTEDAMSQFGVAADSAGGRFRSPGTVQVEGDWSNAAFFLAAQALGNSLEVTGLNDRSSQGDRAASALIPMLQKSNCQVDASDIPDLVPILSVVAACHHGAVFTGIQRLRLKESDRVESVCAMLRALGGRAQATEHILTVEPCVLTGGTVDACGDHRIAMSAAIAATAAAGNVTILGAQCVAKSYPRFWEEYCRLGGKYEQYLR